jgi:hypothetical protein
MSPPEWSLNTWIAVGIALFLALFCAVSWAIGRAFEAGLAAAEKAPPFPLTPD